MEIGSEFERNHISSVGTAGTLGWLPQGTDRALTASGQTAIETALKNIPSKERALVPSYCCDSMLVPFRDLHVSFEFYQVMHDKNGISIEIDESALMKADILFLCNYFGFETVVPDDLIEGFRNKGGIVIEDITHSLLSDRQYHPQSNYLVASVRKWGPIVCGGYCAAMNGKLSCKPTKAPPEGFVCEKLRAMELKSEFLSDLDERRRPTFLSLFQSSNHWLAEHYSDLAIDEFSKEYLTHVDVRSLREARRKNAHALYQGLRGHPYVTPLFPEEAMDCPLFVPVVIRDGRRGKLHQMLIGHKVYCPTHWPHPKADCASNLYDTELSLVCDQRYAEKDMERVISILLENDF